MIFRRKTLRTAQNDRHFAGGKKKKKKEFTRQYIPVFMYIISAYRFYFRPLDYLHLLHFMFH